MPMEKNMDHPTLAGWDLRLSLVVNSGLFPVVTGAFEVNLAPSTSLSSEELAVGVAVMVETSESSLLLFRDSNMVGRSGYCST
jgi:hypothetical protein